MPLCTQSVQDRHQTSSWYRRSLSTVLPSTWCAGVSFSGFQYGNVSVSNRLVEGQRICSIDGGVDFHAGESSEDIYISGLESHCAVSASIIHEYTLSRYETSLLVLFHLLYCTISHSRISHTSRTPQWRARIPISSLQAHQA